MAFFRTCRGRVHEVVTVTASMAHSPVVFRLRPEYLRKHKDKENMIERLRMAGPATGEARSKE